jgi:hypothetical protein
MKMRAIQVVIFPRKVPGPELPKIVELDPPKTAPMLAPFPFCSRTMVTSRTAIIMCKMTAMMYNTLFLSLQSKSKIEKGNG